MISTQSVANMARAFMAVEVAMASVNCGAPVATRAQAEKLLDEYFALVAQAVPLSEDNTLDRRSSMPGRRPFFGALRQFSLHINQSLGGTGVALVALLTQIK